MKFRGVETLRTRSEIIQAIQNKQRNNLIYKHPTLTPETASQYISALANTNGGDIVLGIEDDSQTLIIKNYISFRIKSALEHLNIKVDIEYGSFEYQGHRLFHIAIKKSDNLVKSKGVPFFINPEGELEEMITKTVFLSYCHADADLADIIESEIANYEDITMSRDIKITSYRDDLDEFMRTIRKHDYVISIVSSKYLQSINCMYEITQLMKDENFRQRLLFIVVNSEDSEFYSEKNRYQSFEADIYDYDNRLKYITDLNQKNKDKRQKLVEAELPLELMPEFTLEIRKLAEILPQVAIFMDFLNKKVGKSFKSLKEENFKDFLNIIRA